jgi:hypothetical protein
MGRKVTLQKGVVWLTVMVLAFGALGQTPFRADQQTAGANQDITAKVN